MNIKMRGMKSRVAEHGQVTIPKALRDRLGVLQGTTLEFSEERGRLVAVKATPPSAIDVIAFWHAKRSSGPTL
jgi:antitoxin PrlF